MKNSSKKSWVPSSWQSHHPAQQPTWPDDDRLRDVLKTLSAKPPLIFAGEANALCDELARVCEGEAILLQAGKCAESLSESTDEIMSKLKVILQMAVVLTYSTGMPVVKVGRIAGQFAKPRSNSTETKGDEELPSFRGEMVNSNDFNAHARTADPTRLLGAYDSAAYTLNLLRAFTKGGYASLERVHNWNQEFVKNSAEGQRYEALAGGIDSALSFMRSCGINTSDDPRLNTVNFYSSHEALILQYEEALTRQDSLTENWYDCSAHMLWCGERTRQLDGAHLEFLRGVKNPVGCKIGPSTKPSELNKLCEILNPERIPGKLTLITRFGADNVQEVLPSLIEAVQKAGHKVIWACDPMHGNTFLSEQTGVKTRDFEHICLEIENFFAVHKSAGTYPGGLHLELTGSDVTECLGGPEDLEHSDLLRNQQTQCDPQLNPSQSLDLAFRVSQLFSPVSRA